MSAASAFLPPSHSLSLSLYLSVPAPVRVRELFGRRERRAQLHFGANRQIINVKPGETWPLWLMGLKLFKLHALLNT